MRESQATSYGRGLPDSQFKQFASEIQAIPKFTSVICLGLF